MPWILGNVADDTDVGSMRRTNCTTIIQKDGGAGPSTYEENLQSNTLNSSSGSSGRDLSAYPVSAGARDN